MALIYSGTEKNHAITIGLATAEFGGTLAVFPAAVAPLIQMPMMLGVLNLSKKIRRFIGENDPASGLNPALKETTK